MDTSFVQREIRESQLLTEKSLTPHLVIEIKRNLDDGIINSYVVHYLTHKNRHELKVFLSRKMLEIILEKHKTWEKFLKEFLSKVGKGKMIVRVIDGNSSLSSGSLLTMKHLEVTVNTAVGSVHLSSVFVLEQLSESLQ